MSHYSFEHPSLFLLLLLFVFCTVKCPSKGIAIYLPYVNVLLSNKALKYRWLEIVKYSAITLLFISLASPVKTIKYNNVHQEGRDIMLIIDSSKSMLERGFDLNDLKKDKFEAVKEVVEKFIEDRKNDRVGLINFASTTFIASPLTFDKEFLKEILKKQKVGIAGKRTAIYDALLQAIYILSKSNAKSKIAIVLTDGIDNMSQITFNEILDFVKRAKIKLYTIGIGDSKDIEVPKLEKLAKAGNGEFFLSTNKDTLSKIYERVDKLETSKIVSSTYTKYYYYYYYPLMLSIILMLIYVYFKSIKGIAK